MFDNVHGQVVRTINPKGWETETFYDEWRRPIEQQDFNDRRTRTTYDEYSRVTTVRDELGIDEGRDTVRYTCNQDANLATMSVVGQRTANFPSCSGDSGGRSGPTTTTATS